MVENRGKKGGIQGINGLCVVTKTNAWKTVKCGEEQVEECLNIFWWKLC